MEAFKIHILKYALRNGHFRYVALGTHTACYFGMYIYIYMPHSEVDIERLLLFLVNIFNLGVRARGIVPGMKHGTHRIYFQG